MSTYRYYIPYYYRCDDDSYVSEVQIIQIDAQDSLEALRQAMMHIKLMQLQNDLENLDITEQEYEEAYNDMKHELHPAVWLVEPMVDDIANVKLHRSAQGILDETDEEGYVLSFPLLETQIIHIHPQDDSRIKNEQASD